MHSLHVLSRRLSVSSDAVPLGMAWDSSFLMPAILVKFRWGHPVPNGGDKYAWGGKISDFQQIARYRSNVDIADDLVSDSNHSQINQFLILGLHILRMGER